MEKYKKINYIIILVLLFNSCIKGDLILKGKNNPVDKDFDRLTYTVIKPDKIYYQELKDQFQIIWKKNNIAKTALNPQIWIYKNSIPMLKITSVGVDQTEGALNIDLSKLNFQHLDLMQICFSQNYGSMIWLDSLESPILIYDDTRTPIFSLLKDKNLGKSSIDLYFNIIKAGSNTISEIGVCMNQTGAPTVADQISQCALPFGDGRLFNTTFNNLRANTQYYFRIFCKLNNVVGYTKEQIFKTSLPTLPSVAAPTISNISGSGCSVSSNIINDGGGSIIDRGFVYNKTGNPTMNDPKISISTNTNPFSADIVGLEPMVVYYVAAYAANAAGSTLSNQKSFTTDLPNFNCNISEKTTGTDFTMQTATKLYFRQGESYTVTMFSNIYKFGQASNVSLFDGNTLIEHFGNFLVFTNNSRTFTLPKSIPNSNCYTLQILDNVGKVYVSPKFTIIP